MPILRSGFKRIRQDKKRRLRNQAVLTELTTLSRQINNLLADEKVTEAKTKIHLCIKRLDRAALKGIIPKGRASRKKSRLSLRLNRLNSKK
jgi:small subunit ribosomal protein S20